MLIEHPAVAEAAVVPSPDPVVRRVEFAALPKTVSGKIRRIELRGREDDLHGGPEAPERGPGRGRTEFWEEDFRREQP
ncbi:acyl-coenzyme A synthetase/AMP-(fatty) acid ligase [Streptacidiphilus sp. EB103A]